MRRRLGRGRRSLKRGRAKTWRRLTGLVGEVTCDQRLRPSFLVIGAMKGGTTALFYYLSRHPGFALRRKEIHYFDRHYAQGPRWYFGHFPLRSRAGDVVTGEGSPLYLYHPPVAERVRELLPEVRLIALLRDPIDRALSHYHHQLSKGRETLSFEEAIEAEPERLASRRHLVEAGEPDAVLKVARFSYLSRGLYAEQLERWFERFPREQFLILSSADLSGDPGAVVAEVCRFVGAPHADHDLGSYPRRHERRYPPMSDETRERLARRFEEPNRRLYELLGRDFGWTRPSAG